jgi:hypothetical protein
LSDLGTKYGGATSLALDALGVNGSEGNTRATDAFKAAPGYQYSVDQATDQASRKAASLGIAGSGNTLSGIEEKANNLADQGYNDWLKSLTGFTTSEEKATGDAATGTAGAYKDLSSLYSNDATNRVDVAGNYTSGLTGTNTAAAKADTDSSTNFWNGLLQLGGLGVKAYTGAKGTSKTA